LPLPRDLGDDDARARDEEDTVAAATKTGRLSDTYLQTGASSGTRDSIRREAFAGHHERRLGRTVGITQFGVNHVTLDPGAISSLRHWHEQEDEFIYVLAGELVLVDDNGEHALGAGSFAGFPAGDANAHHLVNRSTVPASFVAVGTRHCGRETIHYPDDAIGVAIVVRDAHGERVRDV
jgi:uncharacterized cupin superfamily protein